MPFMTSWSRRSLTQLFRPSLTSLITVTITHCFNFVCCAEFFFYHSYFQPTMCDCTTTKPVYVFLQIKPNSQTGNQEMAILAVTQRRVMLLDLQLQLGTFRMMIQVFIQFMVGSPPCTIVWVHLDLQVITIKLVWRWVVRV